MIHFGGTTVKIAINVCVDHIPPIEKAKIIGKRLQNWGKKGTINEEKWY